MATLTVRNLPEDTRHALKKRAAHNNRSMEAEARAILESAVAGERNFIEGWLQAAENLRGTPLVFPERTEPREVDLA